MNILCLDVEWKIFHPKHHVTLWVMPFCIYRREDISNSFMRSSNQSIPRPSKPTELCILGKDWAVFFYPSTSHGQRQSKQPESRMCFGEQRALAGWCSLLQRRPWRRDLSLRLSFATVSISTEAASSSQAASPGRERLWNIHTSEEITFVSVDCKATTGWRGEQGKTTGMREGGKKGRMWEMEGELWFLAAKMQQGASWALLEFICEGMCRE